MREKDQVTGPLPKIHTDVIVLRVCICLFVYTHACMHTFFTSSWIMLTGRDRFSPSRKEEITWSSKLWQEHDRPRVQTSWRRNCKRKNQKIRLLHNNFLNFVYDNGNEIRQNRTHKSIHMYLTDRLWLGDLGSFSVLYQCVINKQEPFNVLTGLVRIICLQLWEQIFHTSLREEKKISWYKATL